MATPLSNEEKSSEAACVDHQAVGEPPGIVHEDLCLRVCGVADNSNPLVISHWPLDLLRAPLIDSQKVEIARPRRHKVPPPLSPPSGQTFAHAAANLEGRADPPSSLRRRAPDEGELGQDRLGPRAVVDLTKSLLQYAYAEKDDLHERRT